MLPVNAGGIFFKSPYFKIMPEGPSIVILKEEVAALKITGQRVSEISGNTKIDLSNLQGLKLTDIKSWGKHFLLCFGKYTVRIHFMLFGTYRINERKETAVRLRLKFKSAELNFYACSVKLIAEPLSDLYDWSADVMSDAWDASAARQKLRQGPEIMICDAILDQDIFSGAGNIIKNEVLFRTKIHPATRVGQLTRYKLNQIVDAVPAYSFDFLKWKKEFTLKQHWLVHTKTNCPICGRKLIKEYLGTTKRRTFYCNHCQNLYS